MYVRDSGWIIQQVFCPQQLRCPCLAVDAFDTQSCMLEHRDVPRHTVASDRRRRDQPGRVDTIACGVIGEEAGTNAETVETVTVDGGTLTLKSSNNVRYGFMAYTW